MDGIIRAAVCEKCGAPLDLVTMSCRYCGVNYIIDFSAGFQSGVPTEGGAARLDRCLLSKLQQRAGVLGVQWTVEVQRDGGWNILVVDKEFGLWEMAGSVYRGCDFYEVYGGKEYNHNFGCYIHYNSAQMGSGMTVYRLEPSTGRVAPSMNFRVVGEWELYSKANFLNWWADCTMKVAFTMQNFAKKQAAKRLQEEQRKAAHKKTLLGRLGL